MQIITHPTVQIISRPQFIESALFEIPNDGNDAVKIGAFAAKNCYDSAGKHGRSNEANQRQVLAHEHGSVLEHINYGIYITGITRALSLESNRHRPLAVSQRSTRYTAEEDAAIVLDPYYADLWNKYKLSYTGTPPVTDDALQLLDDFIRSCGASVSAYQQQVEHLIARNPLNLTGFDLRKWARGKARNLLPHALETRIIYTGNVRAWRWFIESRSDKHAEPEIRRLATAVLGTLKTECPLYFEDFECPEIYDNIPVWVPKFSKV